MSKENAKREALMQFESNIQDKLYSSCSDTENIVEEQPTKSNHGSEHLEPKDHPLQVQPTHESSNPKGLNYDEITTIQEFRYIFQQIFLTSWYVFPLYFIL